MYDKVKNALELTPLFRERRYRGHFILIMALREVGAVDINTKIKTGDEVVLKVGSPLKSEPFENVVSSCESITRTWRKILRENENLRGQDYDQKDELENDTLEDLGYKPLTNAQADKALKDI